MTTNNFYDRSVPGIAADLRAVIFDFDGLMIDNERVEADLVIQVLAEWGVAVTYQDFGHLFGSVDADDQWDELLARWCGKGAAELDDRIGAITTMLKDELPLMPGVLDQVESSACRPFDELVNARMMTRLTEAKTATAHELPLCVEPQSPCLGHL